MLTRYMLGIVWMTVCWLLSYLLIDTVPIERHKTLMLCAVLFASVPVIMNDVEMFEVARIASDPEKLKRLGDQLGPQNEYWCRFKAARKFSRLVGNRFALAPRSLDVWNKWWQANGTELVWVPKMRALIEKDLISKPLGDSRSTMS